MLNRRRIFRFASPARAVVAAMAIAGMAVPGTAHAATAETCVLDASTAGMTPIPDIVTDASDLHLEDIEAGVFGLVAGTGPATTCVGTGGVRTPVVGGTGSYAVDYCVEGKMWGTLTLGTDSIVFRMDVAGGYATFDVISVNAAPAVGGGLLTVRPTPAAGCATVPLTGLEFTGSFSYVT